MARNLRSQRWPTCRKLVLRREPDFPFCSERCRTIDLGKWASGGYVISTLITDPEELIDAEGRERQRQRQTGEQTSPESTETHDKSRR